MASKNQSFATAAAEWQCRAVGIGDSRHWTWTYSVFSLAEETPAANKCVLSVVLLRGFVESKVPQFLFDFALKDAHLLTVTDVLF